MKFIKNTKLCFRLILIIVTFNITVIALNYAIGVPQWIIGISLVGIILYTFLLFFLNKNQPLFNYFSNKRAHRLYIFYYSFGTLFAINSTIQLGDSWLKNILFAFTSATVITLIQNAKKVEIVKKHISE